MRKNELARLRTASQLTIPDFALHNARKTKRHFQSFLRKRHRFLTYIRTLEKSSQSFFLFGKPNAKKEQIYYIYFNVVIINRLVLYILDAEKMTKNRPQTLLSQRFYLLPHFLNFLAAKNSNPCRSKISAKIFDFQLENLQSVLSQRFQNFASQFFVFFIKMW